MVMPVVPTRPVTVVPPGMFAPVTPIPTAMLVFDERADTTFELLVVTPLKEKSGGKPDGLATTVFTGILTLLSFIPLPITIPVPPARTASIYGRSVTR